MNINSTNNSIYNAFSTENRKKNDVPLDLGSFSNSSSATNNAFGDKLLDKYWNITDSMPRESQISFAASIVANRVMPQGIMGDNESFVNSIGNKFSVDEINTLKSEIRSVAGVKRFNETEIDSFLKNFDDFIDLQKKTELETTDKQQAQPKFNRANDVFFRATMLMEGIY